MEYLIVSAIVALIIINFINLMLQIFDMFEERRDKK